jgi:sulfur-carrier protein
MQRLTGGQKQVHVAGQTIRQVIDNLDQVFPGLKMELYDAEEDLVMPGIAVVVDGETSQLGLLEHVREDSEIHFLPALGGGAFSRPACFLSPALFPTSLAPAVLVARSALRAADVPRRVAFLPD